jgi:putative FmdB family regulatory protein
MPIYEFKCEHENIVFEKLKKITDTSDEKCPSCGRLAKKILSQSTFHLKGSGWYATDYANKSKDTAKSEKSSAQEPLKEPAKETTLSEPKKEAKALEQKAA